MLVPPPWDVENVHLTDRPIWGLGEGACTSQATSGHPCPRCLPSLIPRACPPGEPGPGLRDPRAAGPPGATTGAAASANSHRGHMTATFPAACTPGGAGGCAGQALSNGAGRRGDGQAGDPTPATSPGLSRPRGSGMRLDVRGVAHSVRCRQRPGGGGACPKRNQDWRKPQSQAVWGSWAEDAPPPRATPSQHPLKLGRGLWGCRAQAECHFLPALCLKGTSHTHWSGGLQGVSARPSPMTLCLAHQLPPRLRPRPRTASPGLHHPHRQLSAGPGSSTLRCTENFSDPNLPAGTAHGCSPRSPGAPACHPGPLRPAPPHSRSRCP